MPDVMDSMRWGTGSRIESGEQAREQILDAARHCYEQQGIAKTTVEDVAKAAKVSRTTVYRYFRNRDEVLSGVVMSDAIALLGMLDEQLGAINDFADFMVEGVLLILREVPKSPLYSSFMGPEGGANLISRLCISSEEVAALIWPVVARPFELSGRGDSPTATLELAEIIEWVARLLLSFMATPSRVATDEPALRAMLDRLLRPVLEPVSA
ncbi:MAG: TetR/AcrR family transcriptional regulator [Gammaproteobacteria bacterium]|nr:MAG: TetR/AcrR family transcriptional regulator [Gammaproteobacteria bacterium]